MKRIVDDDDDALLREVLAFIGDFEADDEELSLLSVGADETTLTADSIVTETLELPLAPQAPAPPLEEASPPPSPQSMNAPSATKSRGNPSRTRRRLELAYLRQHVGELEGQLTKLQHTKAQLQHDETEATTDEKRSSELMAAWKHLATRQYEERQRALHQNAKLKRLLQDQIQVGKSLERILLRKRPSPEDIGRRKRARIGSFAPSWDSREIFNELLASIERQYPETARVLAKAQALGQKIHGRNVELVHNEALGMVLETTESRILPFDYELVVHEFWSAIPRHNSDRISDFHEIDTSGDIIKTQLRGHATFDSWSSDITVFAVDRRIGENQRTVCLSAGFFDPAKVAETTMDGGVYIRHQSWTVFEPVPVDASASANALTRMTSYMVTVPEVFDGLDDRARKVGTLTNFIMATLSIELDSRQEALENSLLARATA